MRGSVHPGGAAPHGSRRLIVEADGGSRGNPGQAGYGALVADAVTGEVLAEVAESIGHATNNVAEYRGLIAGLREAARIAPGAAVEVRMDSKLVIEQMNGRWQVRHPDLRPLARAAREAASALGHVWYGWVPRERNRRADKLANDAMDGTQRLPRGGHKREKGASAGPAPPPASMRTSGWLAPNARSGRPTTTVLLRHGQTSHSVDKRFAGASDLDLTELGVRQARAAAERLASRGDIGAIVTSPLRRAWRTAEEAARATGARVRVDDDLRETDFGAWEGLTFAQAQEKWPAEMGRWLTDPDAAPPGGESFTVVDRRVMSALDRLLATYAGTMVLVVSHVTPIKALVRRALEAPPVTMFRMHLDVASMCDVDWYPDGPAVVCSLNDTAHLTV